MTAQERAPPPPGIRHREACQDSSSLRIGYRHRGARPFVVCAACGAEARVPTLALGIARQGQFTEPLIHSTQKETDVQPSRHP